jgi:hypothetical protein
MVCPLLQINLHLYVCISNPLLAFKWSCIPVSHKRSSCIYILEIFGMSMMRRQAAHARESVCRKWREKERRKLSR